MYLLVGLGNPEEDYSQTRHNMGFDVINKIAKKYKIDISKNKFNGLYGSGNIEGEKVILLKPQTFMNLSGQAIKPFKDFYKIPIENVIVIYDDMDIKPGNIRVRKQGSSGRHNGMKSVIKELSSEKFPRIRVGIGRPTEEYYAIDYVIGKLDKETYKNLEVGIEKAVNATVDAIKCGVEKTMSIYNKVS